MKDGASDYYNTQDGALTQTLWVSSEMGLIFGPWAQTREPRSTHILHCWYNIDMALMGLPSRLDAGSSQARRKLREDRANPPPLQPPYDPLWLSGKHHSVCLHSLACDVSPRQANDPRRARLQRESPQHRRLKACSFRVIRPWYLHKLKTWQNNHCI